MESISEKANVFERSINYYETDRMGIVHHSNYIRFLEEARCEFLKKIGYPYSYLESKGIIIPVLGVNVTYKHAVTFEDVIEINVYIKEFSGVKLTIGYHVTDKKNGNIVIEAETKHCFTTPDLKPMSLKKYYPEFAEKLIQLRDENKKENS